MASVKTKDIFIKSLDYGYVVEVDGKTNAITHTGDVKKRINDEVESLLSGLGSVNVKNMSISVSVDINPPQCL